MFIVQWVWRKDIGWAETQEIVLLTEYNTGSPLYRPPTTRLPFYRMRNMRMASDYISWSSEMGMKITILLLLKGKKRFMCSVAMTTTTGEQDNAKAYRTADRK